MDLQFRSAAAQIHKEVTVGDLTTGKAVLKYRKFRRNQPHPIYRGPSGFMTTKSTSSAPIANVKQPCKHPRVQIVSRDEESEFVECKECGEIFESSEFRDMNIEERTEDSEL